MFVQASIEIKDPSSFTIARNTSVALLNGVAEYTLALSDSPPLGTWTVRASALPSLLGLGCHFAGGGALK